jgi:FkbM family methyltransferase
MLLNKIKKIFRSLIPLSILLPIYNLLLRIIYLTRGIKIIQNTGLIRLLKKNKEIRIRASQKLYLEDILSNFDFYFEGVISLKQGKKEIVDYSMPAWHEVKSFDLMPIYFNSFSEAQTINNKYIELSEISEGSVVIDLGAYSALTSIMFDQRVGQTGLVVAIEADRENYLTCVKNLSLYEKITKKKIHLVNAAIWKDTDGVMFSSEGSMASSAVDLVGNDRAENIFVKTVTLMSLANDFKLERVDFIKCDIEGAESVVLNAPEFFNKYKPRIVIECHIIDGVSTEYSCRSFMENFGYTCTLVDQEGYQLKLLLCHPK